MKFSERIMVVAAHPDDEVLGCGATLARFAADGGVVQTIFLADGESSRFSTTDSKLAEIEERVKQRRAAANLAAAILGTEPPMFFDFPDNRLDTVPLIEIVRVIESALSLFEPVHVFTHFAGDLNVDHQRVHEAVSVATRPQRGLSVREVASFEIPSSTEWGPSSYGQTFSPNYFVDVSDFKSQKFAALQAYESEMREFPYPRSYEAIEALMKWRGSSANLFLAESFILERRIL